jgi:hypothetical protein
MGGSDATDASDRDHASEGFDGAAGARGADGSSQQGAPTDAPGLALDGGDSRGEAASDDADAEAHTDDATAVDADTGTQCGAADPAVDSCIVDDAFGVFVSPTGDDRNAGTRARPFRTIGFALQRAVGRGGRAFVCVSGGTYPEVLSIDSPLSGVALYGGFDCVTWAYLPGLKVVVRPAAATVALTVRNVTALKVYDVEFDATSATSPSSSSVAAFVSASTGVEFVRVKLVAGSGTNGQTGASVADSPLLNGAPGASGNNACERQAAGAPGTGICGTERTVGGIGGLGSVFSGGLGSSGSAGESSPAVSLLQGRGGMGEGQVLGGSLWQCGSVDAGGGQPGGRGADGAPAVGAITSGLVAANGWQSTSGTDGTDGHVGQGGGGGGGAVAPVSCPPLDAGLPSGAAGGSGGAGGCGGRGGGGGSSGGSSIALISSSSDVNLISGEIVTGVAGRGGDGGRGQQGGLGGSGGARGQGSGGSQSSCGGSEGGPGGSGGPGGGGAGGSSIGILGIGGRVTQVGASFQIGAAGEGGRDGNGLSSGPVAGVRGQSIEQML